MTAHSLSAEQIAQVERCVSEAYAYGRLNADRDVSTSQTPAPGVRVGWVYHPVRGVNLRIIGPAWLTDRLCEQYRSARVQVAQREPGIIVILVPLPGEKR